MRGDPSGITSRRAALSCFAGVLSACVTLPVLPASAVAVHEPERAHQLLQAVQGRHPSSGWTAKETSEIDWRVDEVVALRAPPRREMLRGKWRDVYLQRGPAGAGIDRRVPRLELPWNEHYQIFGKTSIVNVDEVFGTLLEVREAGKLREDDAIELAALSPSTAEITEGALCGSITVGKAEKANVGRVCVPLPLRGEDAFSTQYLGTDLRITQRLNGGARVVQVRVRSFAGR